MSASEDELEALFRRLDDKPTQLRTLEESAMLLCLLNKTCPCCWKPIPADTKLGRVIARGVARRQERGELEKK